jgi:NADP-dependent aldehyde dehydrogenase
MTIVKTAAELELSLDSAVTASRWIAATTLTERARLLRTTADALDAAPWLATLAAEETQLDVERMRGEQARMASQFRLYADVVEEGSWLEASMTHERPASTPPIPDLRRMNVPLGLVLVFAASNFPLAFGVAGTDTASALAAGCAVLAKPHPGHPGLGKELHSVVAGALESAGAPVGLFSLVLDDGLAVDTLRDARVSAGAFTGSIRGGTALLEIANSRTRPIPFYAEMGSVNPVVVSSAAMTERRDEIFDGLVSSMTINNGQLCTSPGIVFVPRNSFSDADLVGRLASTAAKPMLTESILGGFVGGQDRYRATPGLRSLGGGDQETVAAPVIWRGRVSAVADSPGTLEECFGPSALVLEYDGLEEVVHVLERMDGQLAGSAFVASGEKVEPDLVSALADRCGRVIVNGWPTGVAVTWSTHHGGPWPSASTPKFGSVGAESVLRFVRPVAYQGFAESELPEALRDSTTWQIPRRVNGTWFDKPATWGDAQT